MEMIVRHQIAIILRLSLSHTDAVTLKKHKNRDEVNQQRHLLASTGEIQYSEEENNKQIHLDLLCQSETTYSLDVLV